MVRFQRFTILLTVIFLAGLSLFLLNGQIGNPSSIHIPPPHLFNNQHDGLQTASTAPEKTHPIAKLIHTAERDFETMRARQSKTLREAVKEYRRRYKMHPPPHFDKWFEYAQQKGVQLIDEFDSIYHSLLPFWGLEPNVIRARAREAMGFDNAVIGLLVRNGKVSLVEGGGEGQQWQREATSGMMDGFVQWLPDMDLVFNIHDEPRVVIPSEDLGRLVNIAKDQAIPASFKVAAPLNEWSTRPFDLNRGDRIMEVPTTRFNHFAHQPTWTNSRMSCPVESPARSLDENEPDEQSSFTLSELGFLSNTTAFSDVCLSPSLRYTYGFFDRPNAFDVVHDLFPVFSQSKVSSFQDIIYPSPWYWAGKVSYDGDKDISWESKQDKMYWRGSTTGGFSRAGGWRRQHRQNFVKKINSPENAKILTKDAEGFWVAKEVRPQEYSGSFDVKFTLISQCDPEDCKAQEEFFGVVKPVNQQDAWAYKHLVDIDGNAFSGRFYAFLRSSSLVYKAAIFREWHDEWLRPWVHYVPLSLKGNEYVESVRYFAFEDEGKITAPRLAAQGQSWASEVLRNEDLEVWFFRLLLEYGRLVDDNRDKIGFSL